MKDFKRHTLLALFILIFSTVSFSQTRSRNVNRSPRQVSTPPQDIKPPLKVEEKYDKFKNESKIFLSMNVPVAGDSTFNLYFSDSSKGAAYTPSGYLTFGLMSDKANWLSSIYDSVYLLADDERFEFNAKMVSAATRFVLLPREAFLKIANAKKVEVKFGITEFTLNANQLVALKELAKRMS